MLAQGSRAACRSVVTDCTIRAPPVAELACDTATSLGGADPLVRTGPPGPVLLLNGQALAAPAEAGRGAGSGRGRPPYHLSQRLYNPAPPVARLASDFLDSHIPQGYQGRSPWLACPVSGSTDSAAGAS